MKRSKEDLLIGPKKVRLVVKTEKSNYVFTSRQEGTRQNHDLKVVNKHF
jgi:hypothetical protein